MIEIECVTKEWGNSLACIIPKEVVQKRHLKKNQKLNIILDESPNTFNRTFGLLKNRKIPTKKLLKEVDEDLWHE